MRLIPLVQHILITKTEGPLEEENDNVDQNFDIPDDCSDGNPDSDEVLLDDQVPIDIGVQIDPSEPSH